MVMFGMNPYGISQVPGLNPYEAPAPVPGPPATRTAQGGGNFLGRLGRFGEDLFSNPAFMFGLGGLSGTNDESAMRNALLGSAAATQAADRRDAIAREAAQRNATVDYLRQTGNYTDEQLAAAQGSPGVLAGMVQQQFAVPKERRTMQDASGRQRYVDTGEYVFGDVQSQPDIKAESELRKEYSKLRKNHDEAYLGFQKVRSAAAGGTPADDVALIFGYMKTLDPNSTVREGEFATAEQTAGIPSRVVNLYNRAIRGDRLEDSQRQQFVESAARQYSTYRNELERVNAQYGNLAGQYGLKPSRVIRPLQPFEMPKNGQTVTLEDGTTVTRID